MNKLFYGWLAGAFAALCLLPWHQQEAGLFAFEWLAGAAFGAPQTAPALLQWLRYGQGPLGALFGLLAIGLAWSLLQRARRRLGAGMLAVSIGALLLCAWIGWRPGAPALGMGYGALVACFCCLMLLTSAAAACGACRGDAFVTGAIGLIIASIALFVMFPVAVILAGAFQGGAEPVSAALLAERFADPGIWGLNCLTSSRNCGVAFNTLWLATATGFAATVMGLVFALLVTRVSGRWARPLRAITILPIVTPPFVLGLALILLFGRNGAITIMVSDWFGIAPGRWLYGMPGVWLAQVLAFAPIAFMTLIGVVEGVSPSLEEASSTMGASRWQTFVRVALPLMRPGIANAFLLCFIESMADFGNPMVLGGNFHVLSTEIFFAVVGAANDPARAATLAIVLLGLAVGAFMLQNLWLGKKSYVTVTGKADNGRHGALDPRLEKTLWALALPWFGFTLLVYGAVLMGGFVQNWGQDNTFTLRHYVDAFGIGGSLGDLAWTGQAWPSLKTTLIISAIATPLTALVGILAAWLLVRQRFAFKTAFEFGTMLSFAIPGTVIGVSYILAFNGAPIELTGTATVLVLCFVFRNMPMGLRTGIAAMRQLDASLDEASITLGANSWTTMRRVILPLLRPAIASALVYGFVRSITSISAVVFLVSADYDMATSYIIGLVSNGNYGTAIAYATVLIGIILLCILLMNLLVGKRRLRRVAVNQPVFKVPSMEASTS
jgi:iron(III) transport system permease protein